MDWSALKAFLAAAEGGSFSAAAKTLRLSQPTVSRQVAELERGLNARLFVRQARGLVLTPSGEGILELARRMEETAVAVERRLSGEEAAAGGLVRVSVTEGLASHWLIDKLVPFRLAHPALALDIRVDNTAVDLARREADIAIRLFRPKQADLVAKRVGSLGLGLYAAASYLARKGEPRALAELAGHDLVGFGEVPYLPPQGAWMMQAAGGRALAFRSNSLTAQYQAVRAGWGIGVVPHFVMASEPAVRRVLAAAKTPVLELWLVVHGDLRRSPRIRLVFDELAALFARHRAELAGG